MSFSKRLFDIALALLLSVVLLPLLLVVLAVMWVRDGRPLFYLSERMKTADEPFQLWKLRTMRPDDGDRGVSGGDKAHRVTRTGRMLRRYRLDEIPQLWNVLRGDMSFVGPRPPLREYVERFPDTYRAVLRSRPGITGLATEVFHAHEEWLLEKCDTAEQTDAVYARACVPRKARLDLIYQRHQSLCFDLVLLSRTAAKVFGRR
ncbi:sugar transferase [Actibacterium sp. MT2.3-13A]|uniref:sugar transferase n=1 Tax=Actibacterium sp. MT2.3-13A TaxID=2828332 RepID=UPI001BA7FD72|nr:sugar transferase [Actibacterium sp. MT2.3-13A]